MTTVILMTLHVLYLMRHSQEGLPEGSMKPWFAKVGVKELEGPAQNPNLNPNEHVGDEWERQLHP